MTIFKTKVAAALSLSFLLSAALPNLVVAQDEPTVYAESDGDGFDSETGAYNPDPSNSEISEQESLDAPVSEPSEISTQDSTSDTAISKSGSRDSGISDRDVKLARESVDLAARAGFAEGLRLLAFWPDDAHDAVVPSGTPIIGCSYPYTLQCLALNLGDLATDPSSSLGSYQFTLDPSLPHTSFSKLNQNAIDYTDLNLRKAEFFDPTSNKSLSTTASFLGLLAPRVVRTALSGNPLGPSGTQLLTTAEPQLAYAVASRGTPELRETVEMGTQSIASSFNPVQSSLTLAAARPLTSESVPSGKDFKGTPTAKRLLDATLKREADIRKGFESSPVDIPTEKAVLDELNSARKNASQADIKAVAQYLASLKSSGESWGCLSTYHANCVDPWVDELQEALHRRYGIDPSTFNKVLVSREQMWAEVPAMRDAYRRAGLTHEEIFLSQLQSGAAFAATKPEPDTLSSYGTTMYREWTWPRSGGQHFFETYSRRAETNLAGLLQDSNIAQWTRDDATAFLDKTIFAQPRWLNDEANFVFLRAAAEDAVRKGKLPPTVVDLLTEAFLTPPGVTGVK